MLARDFLQTLLERTDIVRLVGEYIELKKAGHDYVGLCPFHKERSPSFTVTATKQFYHCFGCGEHDTAVGFLMKHVGMSFRDAVADLASRAGMLVPEEERSPEEARERAVQQAQRERLLKCLAAADRLYREALRKSPEAVAYLKGRDVTGKIAARFAMGWAPSSRDFLLKGLTAQGFTAEDLVRTGLCVALDERGQAVEPSAFDAGRHRVDHDRLRARIVFPIRNAKGEIVGFGGRAIAAEVKPKYLNSPDTLVFNKGDELYGIYEARQAVARTDCALVVEGYLDVSMLAQNGIENAVAAMGTSCSASQIRKLLRMAKTVIFAFDGDEAGRKAANRALLASLPALSDDRSVRFLFLPSGHDPDSFVREQGPQAFENATLSATPLSALLIEDLSEGLNLDLPEGRAQLQSRTKAILRKMEATAFRAQLAGELARLAQVPLSDILGGVEDEPVRGDFPRRGGPSGPRLHQGARVEIQQVDHAKTALAILLSYPEHWHSVLEAQRELLCAEDSSVCDLARWLERTLDEDPDIPASTLWEMLRGEGLLEKAQESGTTDLLDSSPEVVLADLLGALRHVELQWIHKRQAQISHSGLLDEAAIQELRGLTRRRLELSQHRPVLAATT